MLLRSICIIVSGIEAVRTLGHGRLIFRMADFWRALCEQSVGQEKEKKKKKKNGLLQFFSDT